MPNSTFKTIEEIKPSEIIYDISGRTPRTIEAAKAWNVLSEVLTLHRQKYSDLLSSKATNQHKRSSPRATPLYDVSFLFIRY